MKLWILYSKIVFNFQLRNPKSKFFNVELTVGNNDKYALDFGFKEQNVFSALVQTPDGGLGGKLAYTVTPPPKKKPCDISSSNVGLPFCQMVKNRQKIALTYEILPNWQKLAKSVHTGGRRRRVRDNRTLKWKEMKASSPCIGQSYLDACFRVLFLI